MHEKGTIHWLKYKIWMLKKENMNQGSDKIFDLEQNNQNTIQAKSECGFSLFPLVNWLLNFDI